MSTRALPSHEQRVKFDSTLATPSLLAWCVHGFSKTPGPAPVAPPIHEQTQSALCQLPADILEAITDAMTPVERICLALTCKGLMGICMPKDIEKVKKHPSQTFQLLMNLEVLGVTSILVIRAQNSTSERADEGSLKDSPRSANVRSQKTEGLSKYAPTTISATACSSLRGGTNSLEGPWGC